MRTFVSATLVLAFTLLGSLALAAHVTAHTVLNPERSSTLAGAAVDALPGTAALDPLTKPLLEGLVADPDTRARIAGILTENPELAADVTALADDAKNIETAKARRQLARHLALAGHKDLARQVRAGTQTPGATINVDDLTQAAGTQFTKWRNTLTSWALTAALLASAAAAAGIAAARSRRNVARGIANALIVCLGLTCATFIGVPRLLDALSDAGWWQNLSDALAEAGNQVAGPLLPLLGAAIVLRITAPHLPEQAGAALRRNPTRHGAGPGATPAPFGHGTRAGLPGAELHQHLPDPDGSHYAGDHRGR